MTANLDSNIENILKISACIPDRDQSGSILRISSFFLFNIDIVRHFNTVNNSDTAEAGHTRALDKCSCYRIGREASVSLIRQSVTPTARARVQYRYASLCFTALQSTTSWRNCTLSVRQLPEPAASTIPTASPGIFCQVWGPVQSPGSHNL